MTKMYLQYPVTFHVHLTLTCSVNDNLMVQITFFLECPTVPGTRVSRLPFCVEMLYESLRKRPQIDFLDTLTAPGFIGGTDI